MKRQPCPRFLFAARIGLLVALAVMQLYASAQQPQSKTKQPPETAAQTPAPVLRVTTRLVEVNVIVRDGKGKHIPGLTKDDFTLMEQGQAQKISLFSEQVVDPIAAAPPRMTTPAGTVIFSNRAQDTAVAIASIADHLAELPGRKNLVWVSTGFPFQIGTGTAADDPGPGNPTGGPAGKSMPGPSSNQRYQTFEKEIERASQVLTSADVAIYPVDARGMVGFRNLSPSIQSLPRTRTNSRVPAATGPPLGVPSRLNTDAMEVMANRTGGKAFFNTNDIGGAIRHAIDDASATYVLGYYPTNSLWDGRFREITVDVKRSGAHVRYRKGYFAYAEPAVDIQREKERMGQVIESPLQDAEWKLRVAVTPKTEPAGGFTETLNVVFSQQAYEASLRDGLKFSREVVIIAGAVLVRFVACDFGSGAIGSVDIPLQKVFPHEGSPTTLRIN